MSVNGWSVDAAERHVRTAFKEWNHRSAAVWNLDLSILTNAGIRLNEPAAAGDRNRISALVQRRPEDAARTRYETPTAANACAAAPHAGWYPDPLRRYRHRWWNGWVWTDVVAPRGRLTTDPL
jgi:hypothetical protein